MRIAEETVMLVKIQKTLESRAFEWVITALILVNAVILGMETSPAIMAKWGPLLTGLDKTLLTIFVAELGLSVLRALRVLRVLRLITIIPSLKRVVGAMLSALPGMGSIIVLLTLVFYVSGVMATKLFAATEPEAFGDLGRSLYTLFQLMTLDGWSGEIVKPVLENHPYAMLFFLPFILFSAFVVLNLFIGVVVGAMQDEAQDVVASAALTAQAREEALLHEMRALRGEVEALRDLMKRT
jgi:voltage-gated sodium channel